MSLLAHSLFLPGWLSESLELEQLGLSYPVRLTHLLEHRKLTLPSQARSSPPSARPKTATRPGNLTIPSTPLPLPPPPRSATFSLPVPTSVTLPPFLTAPSSPSSTAPAPRSPTSTYGKPSPTCAAPPKSSEASSSATASSSLSAVSRAPSGPCGRTRSVSARTGTA